MYLCTNVFGSYGKKEENIVINDASSVTPDILSILAGGISETNMLLVLFLNLGGLYQCSVIVFLFGKSPEKNIQVNDKALDIHLDYQQLWEHGPKCN